MLHTSLLLDGLLHRHADALGNDFNGYRNHVYRVINFCSRLTTLNAEQLEKIIIAGAFHDLGIWTAGTFDYLPPSRRLAEGYLQETGRQAWTADIVAMIDDHHKIRRSRAGSQGLAEVFRRADWIDVSHALIACVLSRRQCREVFAAFPDAGFHRRLVRLTLRRLRTHPLNPLPMMWL